MGEQKQIVTNRIEYIDIMRGLGILLMIMGHIGFGKSFDTYIHAFHMPVFYVISGYLFKNNPVPTEAFVVRKARQLFIPYFVFAVTGFLGTYMTGGINGIDFWSKLNDTFFNPTIRGVPLAGALWFLPALFWINVIFHYLHKWFGKNDYILFAITLVTGFVGMLATERYNIYLPMGLDAALSGVAFIGTGYFLKQMMHRKFIHACFHMNVEVFIVMALLQAYLAFFNGDVNFRTGQYGNIVLAWFNAMLGSILLWNLSRWLGYALNKWKKLIIIQGIMQIGANSLTFVCLNQWIIQVVSNSVAIPAWDSLGIPYLKETLILCIVCFILCVIMQILENSKLRVLLGKNREI